MSAEPCIVLVSVRPKPGKKQIMTVERRPVVAANALTAGWKLIQEQGIDSRAIMAVAAPDGPFLPWAGHLKDYDPKTPSTRRWKCLCTYMKAGERIEEYFLCCGRDSDDVATQLSILDEYQPQKLKLEFVNGFRVTGNLPIIGRNGLFNDPNQP